MVAWEEKCHNLKYSPWNLLVLSFYHWTQHHMGWKIPLLSWSQLALPMSCPLVSVLWDEGRQEALLLCEPSSAGSTDRLSARFNHRSPAPVSCCEGSWWHTHTRTSPLRRGLQSHSGKGQPPLAEWWKSCCTGVTESVQYWTVRDGQEDEQWSSPSITGQKTVYLQCLVHGVLSESLLTVGFK